MGAGIEAKSVTWEHAKLEAIGAIVRAGKKEQLITYSELASSVSAIALEPFGADMNRLLDDISKDEDADGRPMLTALVVLKDERVPAEGFWASARGIGMKFDDQWIFWADQVKKVFEACKTHPLCL